ncbi:MAG: hypothetical protein JWM96_56 [Alphaproteobacteria bacterium]|nr:hypothetical protein [Alphaproteobacteria bacterium]
MPKTDINNLLKKSAETKIDILDYSSPEQQKKWQENRERREAHRHVDAVQLEHHFHCGASSLKY